MSLSLVREMMRVQQEQEAFERVHYNDFQTHQIKAKHIERLKTQGEILVGCLKPSCIYKLTYHKETKNVKIETFRSDVRGTAAFAGWPHEKLMNYMCGGVVYEEDLLVAKRRPESEIIGLEKAHQKKLLIEDIKGWFALLSLATMAILPFVLHYLKPR